MSKMRSPNYPAYSLRSCMDWISRIWEKEGRTPVSSEIAAIAAGYKGLSGPSRTAIASMKKFGLLDESSDGVRVSPLALSIIHPVKSGEDTLALREAALRPALFVQLAEQHLDASVQAITSFLITRMGFSHTGAVTCAEAFKDTVQFAKLDVVSEEQLLDPSKSQVPPNEELPRTEATDALVRDSRKTHVFVWPLTNGVFAEVSFSGNELSDEDIDLLCAYLNLAKRGLVQRND